MSKAKNLFFGVAIAFAFWNVMNHGLSVQSGAIVLLVLVCFAINIYNSNQKRIAIEKAEAKIREREQIRRIRAEARRKQGRKKSKKNTIEADKVDKG